MLQNFYLFLIITYCVTGTVSQGTEIICEYSKNGLLPSIWCTGQLGHNRPLSTNQRLKGALAKDNITPLSIKSILLSFGQAYDFKMEGGEFDGFSNVEDIAIRTAYSERRSLLGSTTFSNLPKMQNLTLDGFKLTPDASAGLQPLYKSLRRLEILKSSVGANAEIFRNFENLYYVSVYDSDMEELDADTFQKSASNITVLSIIRSRLEKIKATAFQDFYNLQELVLEKNEISLIEPGSFNNLKKLRNLNLKENNLGGLPDKIFTHNGVLCKLELDGNPSERVTNQTFVKPSCDSCGSLQVNGILLCASVAVILLIVL